jgi:hypothetical protein
MLSTALVLAVIVSAPRPAPLVAQGPQQQGQAVPGQDPVQPVTPELPVQPPRWVPIVDPHVWLDSKPPSRLDAWLSSIDINCVACGDVGAIGPLPTPTNANAPWAFQGVLRRDTAAGAFSAGIIGVRNHAAPLYTAMPIGGTFSPGASSTSRANFFVPATQWHLTASVERTLLTMPRGATLGIVGDLLLPINTNPSFDDKLRTDPLPSRAVRVGIAFRW